MSSALAWRISGQVVTEASFEYAAALIDVNETAGSVAPGMFGKLKAATRRIVKQRNAIEARSALQ